MFHHLGACSTGEFYIPSVLYETILLEIVPLEVVLEEALLKEVVPFEVIL